MVQGSRQRVRAQPEATSNGASLPGVPGRLRRIGLALLLALLLLIPAPAWAAADGAQLFEQHCAGCHWGGGNIIRRGKTLKLAALQRNGVAEEAAVAAIIRNGVGQMGSYAEALGEEGIEPVAAYVWQQAEANWPRPS